MHKSAWYTLNCFPKVKQVRRLYIPPIELSDSASSIISIDICSVPDLMLAPPDPRLAPSVETLIPPALPTVSSSVSVFTVLVPDSC